MTKSKVHTEKYFDTQDQHALTLTVQFSSEPTDLSLTFDSRITDQEYKIGDRVKSFQAILTLAFQSDEAALVFHAGDPDSTQVIEDATIVVPATIIDGFWLRQDESLREALIQAALDENISPELQALLQPALASFANLASDCFASMKLDAFAEKKSAGILRHKPTEYHVSLKQLDEVLREQLITRLEPTLQQVSYCLGRHEKTLNHQWRSAIDRLAAPASVSKADMDSEKWGSRFATLQKSGWFDAEKNVNWKRVDEMTQGCKLLNRFIEKLISAPRHGIEHLTGGLGILTPDSTEEKWKVASMARLLHYFVATARKS